MMKNKRVKQIIHSVTGIYFACDSDIDPNEFFLVDRVEIKNNCELIIHRLYQGVKSLTGEQLKGLSNGKQ